MSIGDAAEIGIRAVLVGLKNKQLIEQELKRTDTDLIELSQRQAALREMVEQLDNIKLEVIESNNGNSAELEQHRNELFEKSKNSAVKLWNKGDINWEKVVASYRFADKKEAMEWLKSKIEGLK